MSQTSKGLAKDIEDKKKKYAEIKARNEARRLEKEKEKDSQKAIPTASPVKSIRESADDLLSQVTKELELSKDPKPVPTMPVLSQPTSVAVTHRALPTLGVYTPEPVSIQPLEVIKYEQGIQVDIISTEDAERLQEREKEFEQRIAKERTNLAQIEQTLKARLAEVEQQQRELEKRKAEEEAKAQPYSAAERTRIMEGSEFKEFFNRASLVVERALAETSTSPFGGYDLTTDYYDDDSKEKDHEQKTEDKLVQRFCFTESKKTKNRPITAMDWNPKHPELLLASYAGQEDQLSVDPDGTVIIWNLHLTTRPEYTFYCQSAVLTAQFHPSSPKLIIGGTRSGQVVMWDMREKNKTSPVNRTSLSSGHTHPVFSLATVATVGRVHKIVSVSTDGHLCVWSDNNLHAPSSEIILRGKEEITTNSFDFPGRETNSVILGSDEGYIYKAQIFEKKGIVDQIRAHTAPITNIHCHPLYKTKPGASNLSNFFLTSSYDWTVKLWNNKIKRPLLTFESARDYVYDVQWSPTHPAVFASGDGLGKIDLWNLNGDAEVPAFTAKIPEAAAPTGEVAAISRLKWANDGKYLAAGTSTGNVYVFEVPADVHSPDKEASDNFYEKVSRWSSRGSSKEADDSDATPTTTATSPSSGVPQSPTQPAPPATTEKATTD